jgi:isochorismate hydrolase
VNDYLDKISRYNVRRAYPQPARSALLVVDVQRYFDTLTTPILANVRRLIDVSHAQGVQVVFTRHGHREPAKDGGMLSEWWGDLIPYGAPEWHLSDRIRPSDRDWIIDKNRYSAFHGTDLDARLGRSDIRDLIIAGVMTNCCCETTARDAFVRDYRVFFVADATATVNDELHLASLKNLAFAFAYIADTDGVCQWIATPPR